MMKKFTVCSIILVLSVQSNLFAKNPNSQMENIKKEIELLNKEIESEHEYSSKNIGELKMEMETLRKRFQEFDSQVNTSHTMMSNHIATASWIFVIGSIILTLAGFFVGYYVNKQGEKIDRMTAVSKEYNDFIQANLAGLNDKLQAEEALVLLQKLKDSPSNFKPIYERLRIINISKKDYDKFKVLIKFSEGLASKDTDESRAYQDFVNQTIPLLLIHFPLQLYLDAELSEEIRADNDLNMISLHQQRECIIALNEAVNKTDLDRQLVSIEKLLVGITLYSPSLLQEFKKILGDEKIDELRKKWNGGHFKDYPVIKQTLKEQGLI
jgi:hypothetical protein